MLFLYFRILEKLALLATIPPQIPPRFAPHSPPDKHTKKMKTTPLFLLTAAFLTTSLTAATVPLSGTWSEFDWNQTNPVAPNAGILALSGQSSSGFTAAIGQNLLDVDGNAGVDSAGRPRVFQLFAPQALSALGDTVTLSFKATAANGMVAGDSQFRFAFTDTAHNQGLWASTDMGTPGGNAATTRFDNSITDPAVSASYVAGNFGHFLNSGGTRGNSGVIPNGTAIGDPLVSLTTEHFYTLAVSRVVGGLSWNFSYGNNAGAAGPETVTIGAVFDDSITQANGANAVMSSVDGIAFLLFNDAPFGAGNTGSFTISDVVVTGVAVVPEPASASLISLGTFAFAARRRRK